MCPSEGAVPPPRCNQSATTRLGSRTAAWRSLELEVAPSCPLNVKRSFGLFFTFGGGGIGVLRGGIWVVVAGWQPFWWWTSGRRGLHTYMVWLWTDLLHGTPPPKRNGTGVRSEQSVWMTDYGAQRHPTRTELTEL